MAEGESATRQPQTNAPGWLVERWTQDGVYWWCARPGQVYWSTDPQQAVDFPSEMVADAFAQRFCPDGYAVRREDVERLM